MPSNERRKKQEDGTGRLKHVKQMSGPHHKREQRIGETLLVGEASHSRRKARVRDTVHIADVPRRRLACRSRIADDVRSLDLRTTHRDARTHSAA